MTESSKNKNTWAVYCHTSPSGKKYIGITSKQPIERRFGKNGLYYQRCTYFYRAIQKYGWDSIKHEVIETNLDYKTATEKEKYYIKHYKSNEPQYGYNLTNGGDGTEGYILSDEAKAKLSAKRQGVNSCGYGSFPSEETKRKMSEKGKQRTFGKETRKKMSEEKMKEVYQYTIGGEFIKKYNSASDASEQTGTNIGNLCACCRNIVKRANGFYWSYTKIDNPKIIEDYQNGLIIFEKIYTRNEKPVLKLDLSGNILCKYNSIKEASEDTNIPAQEISHSCKNKNAVTREYQWRYANGI